MWPEPGRITNYELRIREEGRGKREEGRGKKSGLSNESKIKKSNLV
jgi:hypothetical protein